MAVNGTITQTAFTTPTVGTIIRRTGLEELSTAISANVDNCGNCAPANCCQSCQTTASVCQSCQSTSCQESNCNCNCNCGG